MKEVKSEDTRLAISKGKFVDFLSPRLASQMSCDIHLLRRTPEKDRMAEIEKIMSESLDVDEIEKQLPGQSGLFRTLDGLGLALMVVLFLLVPLRVYAGWPLGQFFLAGSASLVFLAVLGFNLAL